MNASKFEEVCLSIGINNFQYFPTIGSTNDEAFAWIESGAKDFSVIVADEQTKGKGRFDRRWVTKPGSSLAFSVILKPTIEETTKLALFAPLCGLAVHDALFDLYQIDSEIKWPNDILINRKKCCGILVEADWKGSELNGLVLGIGININHGSLPPTHDSLFPAACLEDVVSLAVNRYQVLKQVILQIKKWRPLLATELFFNHWQNHLAFKHEQVMIVQSENESIIGIEKGINREGQIVLLCEDHTEKTFDVGDIHLRPLDGIIANGENHDR